MKVTAVNREDDGYPMLRLLAENDKDGEELTKLLDSIPAVQKIGIAHRVAEECDPLSAIQLMDQNVMYDLCLLRS